MELLNDADATDPVSRVLRAAEVRSTVYCRSHMRAPWGFGVEAHGNPVFHVVTSGHSWLEVEGRAGQIAVASGDLIILPSGARHWMRDDPSTRAVELDDLLTSVPPDNERRLSFGGGGAETALVCGGFTLQNREAHPILRTLPDVMHVPGDDGRSRPWLAATLELLGSESESRAPGSEEIVRRLADALIAQALRAALLELQSSDGAPTILAIHDRHVAAAVGLIHDDLERVWTVGELAEAVALSRSAFAAHFRAAVGESPLRYLTRTRLAHAARLLQDTDASVAQVAARVGYGNEFSFGKAFKRMFGVAPGASRGREIYPPISTVAHAADTRDARMPRRRAPRN
jgi:AraC-like DNA-binding protein/mannose-6-phosphate isomerase-like protein (cupin superfamily)